MHQPSGATNMVSKMMTSRNLQRFCGGAGQQVSTRMVLWGTFGLRKCTRGPFAWTLAGRHRRGAAQQVSTRMVLWCTFGRRLCKFALVVVESTKSHCHVVPSFVVSSPAAAAAVTDPAAVWCTAVTAPCCCCACYCWSAAARALLRACCCCCSAAA